MSGTRRIWRTILAVLGFIAFPAVAAAHDVAIDMTSARAVATALGRGDLSVEEAKSIADLPASQALVRKMASYGETASADRFAAELVAAAHGTAPAEKPIFAFDDVKAHRAEILATLDAFAADEAATLAWLEARLAAFSPPGPALRLRGYIVAGGRAGGFALGGSDFYLNAAQLRGDAAGMRIMMAHELYHAVVGGARQALAKAGVHSAAADVPPDAAAVEKYLSNLLQEGVATYVGDPALLTGDGLFSRSERERWKAHVDRIDRVSALLDVALVALTSKPSVPLDEAYAVGFYLPSQPLYYLGYTMAKAIAAKEGKARVGILVLGSGCGFVRDYIELTASDPTLPKLGADTRRIVAADCR